MPRTDAKFAYTDCYTILDQALLDGEGVRVGFRDEDACHVFRHRLNYARMLDRRQNKDVYEKDHPMFGQSEYDKLQFTIKESASDWKEAPSPWWVYVTHLKMPAIVEGLSQPIQEVTDAKTAG